MKVHGVGGGGEGPTNKQLFVYCGKGKRRRTNRDRDTRHTRAHRHAGARAHRRAHTPTKIEDSQGLRLGPKSFVIVADNNNLLQSKSLVIKDINNNTKNAHVPPMLHAKTPRSDADSPV